MRIDVEWKENSVNENPPQGTNLSPPPPPRIMTRTVMMENPTKTTNWGPLLRCCAAFGISQVLVVGYDKCNVQGSHGASKHVSLLAFPTHQQAYDYLQQKYDGKVQWLGIMGGIARTEEDDVMHSWTSRRDCISTQIVQRDLILRSEIDPSNGEDSMDYNADKTQAEPVPCARRTVSTTARTVPKRSHSVSTRTFSSDVHCCCFVVGKKRNGLPISLAQLCDSLVHIPHTNIMGNHDDADSTSSLLSTEACFCIVLHEYMAWSQQQREGQGTSISGTDETSTEIIGTSSFVGQKYKVEKIQKGSIKLQLIQRQERLREKQRKQDMVESTLEDAGMLFGDCDTVEEEVEVDTNIYSQSQR